MKALNPAQFVQSIEYTSEKVLRLLGIRKPAVYRLSGTQITESRIRLVQRKFN